MSSIPPPSSPPSIHTPPPPPPRTIFEAIEHDNWEGLLALYATAARDAVRSTVLARYSHHYDDNNAINNDSRSNNNSLLRYSGSFSLPVAASSTSSSPPSSASASQSSRRSIGLLSPSSPPQPRPSSPSSSSSSLSRNTSNFAAALFAGVVDVATANGTTTSSTTSEGANSAANIRSRSSNGSNPTSTNTDGGARGEGAASGYALPMVVGSVDDASGNSTNREGEGGYYFFRDEKKPAPWNKSNYNYPSSSSTRTPLPILYSPALEELDEIVHTILGAINGDDTNHNNSSSSNVIHKGNYKEEEEEEEDDDGIGDNNEPLFQSSLHALSSSNHQPYKKTRQNSPLNRSSSSSNGGGNAVNNGGGGGGGGDNNQQSRKTSALDRLLLLHNNNNNNNNKSQYNNRNITRSTSYASSPTSSSHSNMNNSRNNNNNILSSSLHWDRNANSIPYATTTTNNNNSNNTTTRTFSFSSPSSSAANTAMQAIHARKERQFRRQEAEWERVMWKSASSLSNSQPHPSYVVHRSVRNRREGMLVASDVGIGIGGGNLKSEEEGVGEGEEDAENYFMEEDDTEDDDDEDEDEEDNSNSNSGNDNNNNPSSTHHNHNRSNINNTNTTTNNNNITSKKNKKKKKKQPTPPLFEGTIANSTPGQSRLDGSGFGTAQHLACLLDSPLALSILIALGVNVQACHTAFRRLAIHEAACADSPRCLGFLMESGRRFEMEVLERRMVMKEEEVEDRRRRLRLGGGSCLFGEGGNSGRGGGRVKDVSMDMEEISSEYASAASASLAAASATGFGSSFDGSDYASSSGASSSQDDNAGCRKLGGKMKLNLFSGCGWGAGSGNEGRRGRGRSPFVGGSDLKKKSSHHEDALASSPCLEALPPARAKSNGEDLTSFPTALKIIWETIQLLRSGEMSELDAAHHILDRVSAPLASKKALALQCSNTPDNWDSERRSRTSERSSLSSATSALVSLYGLTSLAGGGTGNASNHLSFYPPANISHSDSVSNPHNVDGHGNAPLHWAGFKNSVRAIDVLLSYNVDVNAKAFPSGWSALHDSSYSDSAEAVERLIAAGAEVDARSKSGATPLCFAAQEDSPNAARLLMEAGADPSMRCLGENPPGSSSQGQRAEGEANAANNIARQNSFHSRFSGYTPLHYCAHYNAANAARVLLDGSKHHGISGADLLEIPDLNEKLPIHIAVARGSSEVLRELLHGGARVETASYHPPPSPRSRLVAEAVATNVAVRSAPMSIPSNGAGTEGSATVVVTPVSSPVLRSMIPTQPVTSSKPWNCLSQKAIDACRSLIEEVEQNWTPERHALFSPTDRLAVKEVLRVGKRLEQQGSGIFLELWPFVLSFCGRGWFEPTQEFEMGDDSKVEAKQKSAVLEDEVMQCSSDEDVEFTQFKLEETDMAIV